MAVFKFKQVTLFIADGVGSGRPVSQARGSCIKRSTEGIIRLDYQPLLRWSLYM